jgi:uncharacterized damage-inducible protein DinB
MTWRSAIDLQHGQAQVRTALAAALAGLSEDRAADTPAPHTWSIHEILAHLVATEQRVLDDMHLMLRQDHPELPSIRHLDDPARLQAILQQAGTLVELLAAFDAACQATLALVEHLDDEQELRSGRSPELGHVLLGSYATVNTYYHYPGHIEEIWTARRHLGLSDDDRLRTPRLRSGFLV